MKNKNSLSSVFVQKVEDRSSTKKMDKIMNDKQKTERKLTMIEGLKVEDNSSSEEMTKIVNDKQKIEKIITLVEGLKVEVTNSENFMKQMKSQNTYMFIFLKGDKFQSGKPAPYSFSVSNDGTFIFTHKTVNSPQKPRITIAKHKDLLNQMKQILDIDF